MRRIDPDMLHMYLRDRWGSVEANLVCPEVEPERPEPYDYHADWYRLNADPYGVDAKFECRRCGGTQGIQPTARHACPEAAEPERVTVAETATHSRYPGDLAPMMDIHGPQRRRVMFSSPENGYPGDAKRAVAYLVPGMLYSTVSVDVGSSRTNVELAECPGVRFNSVHFIDWPPAACPERPAEPVSDRCDCDMFGYIHTRRECDKYRDEGM